ncbi:hypothetical protein V5074_20135 [Atlantibacter hermannii]|uniref:hypothetical protein n=1 Tax=Atlantibacter hermannii TaxID=565 RepID=UPI0030763030
MTINERVSDETLDKIIEAADEVITALAGTNEDVHKNDSAKMCQLWDDLNDRYATPAIVKALAAEIKQYRAAAEPVAWTCQGALVDVQCGNTAMMGPEGKVGFEPLHAAPQVTSVPDCFNNAVSALESLYRNGQKQNWNERYTSDMAYASGVLNACRAAMLNGGKS